MPISNSDRARRRREAMRAAGLRPVQIWVPDMRRPGFTEECRRQSAVTADADRADGEVLDLLDDLLEAELATE